MYSTCDICCESINKLSHKEVKCQFCEYTACRTCCQTYILGESIVKCMDSNCGREWTRKYISDNLAISFVNGPLKKHREDILYDKERALLPTTQYLAEEQLRIRNIDDELSSLKKEYKIINLRIDKLKVDRNVKKVVTNGDRHITRNCSINDCRGFLDSEWKCGLCESWFCRYCHMLIGNSIDTPHNCDTNDIESAKLLKSETKHCPKCSVSIFKIDGCDQMWCTQCHTAFSWKSGCIQKSIHNPHYFEWLRNSNIEVPRNRLDSGCQNNTLDDYTFGQFCKFKTILGNINYLKISNICQYLMELRYYSTQDDRYENINIKLRIKYLMKDIDTQTFKTRIQQSEKKHLKKREIQEVYQMVFSAGSDNIVRFYNYLVSSPKIELDTYILDEINDLLNYANRCLFDIEKTYGGAIMYFNENYKLSAHNDIR